MLTRRSFLTALGIGAAALAIEEPVRKLWFVGSNAPVGSRIERATHHGDDYLALVELEHGEFFQLTTAGRMELFKAIGDTPYSGAFTLEERKREEEAMARAMKRMWEPGIWAKYCDIVLAGKS